MSTASYFKFGGLRCSPLNAALCVFLENGVSDEN
ncbi:acetyltransferase [Vibrio mimicus]|nr:acetyltransferase [Vibrio mimicus]